jgi:Na+/melibiose symporter-like transporter
MLFTVIPAAIGIVALIIYLVYPLNDIKVKQMTDELQARRVAAEDQI